MDSFDSNGVECPLCESKFSSFLPFGLDKRPNAQCSYCLSLERTRLYWLYLKSVPFFFTSKIRLLHVAPQKTLFKRFRQVSSFEYYPVDKFAEGYSYAEGTLEMDITDIKYPNDMFDFILCSHVLEHVHDDKAAMKELYRVLKPGGFGIIQVPIDKSRAVTLEDDKSITDPLEREKVFGQADHVRVYGLDYKDKLSSVGFKVDVNQFLSTFSEKERLRYGIKDRNLYIVHK